VGGQKLFERVRNFVCGNILNVFKGLLGGSEWLIGCKLDHLGEPLKRSNGFLYLAELSSSSIELLLLEEAVSRSGFVQNVKLRHF